MKKNKNFKNILEELKTLKTQLSEDYLFKDEDGYMDDDMDMHRDIDRDMHRDMDKGDDRMMDMERSHDQDMMAQGDSEEEIAMHAHEVIKHEPIIGKIRETAIEGLKKYADHPTSSLYEFFKKVFLESDKVLTDTGGKK